MGGGGGVQNECTLIFKEHNKKVLYIFYKLRCDKPVQMNAFSIANYCYDPDNVKIQRACNNSESENVCCGGYLFNRGTL